MCRMVKGCIQMESAPELDWMLDMTPADFCSDSIVHLSLHQDYRWCTAAQTGDTSSTADQSDSTGLGALPRPRCSVYHLCNPTPVHAREFWQWLDDFGYNLSVIPYSKWRQMLLKAVSTPNTGRGAGARADPRAMNALAPLVPTFSEAAEDMGTTETMPKFDLSATSQALAQGGIACPDITDSLLTLYYSYFVNTGFLPAPQRDVEQFSLNLDDDGDMPRLDG